MIIPLLDGLGMVAHCSSPEWWLQVRPPFFVRPWWLQLDDWLGSGILPQRLQLLLVRICSVWTTSHCVGIWTVASD